MKTVLTIAGSDSSGGAGIQADIKAISAMGCFAASAITAITVQNTLGVEAVHPVPLDILAGQIDAVLSDIGADAIKIGMLHSAEVVNLVADKIEKYGIRNVVLDPVMVSTSGHKLIEDSAIDAQMQRLEDIKKLNEAAAYKANPIKPTIAFEDFEKLDIRVGKVLECENVPKMKKLLKFKIADGLENRTIISGIAQHYKPEELVGKQVLFIANLAPRQFKNGLVSEGMILSAENYDGTLAVTSLLKEVAPGSEVK